MSDRDINQQVRRTASSSEVPEVRSTGSKHRTTSIRWAKNLPIPDRRLSPSSVNNLTSSPKARRAAFQYNDSDINDEPKFSTQDHAKYVAGQRAYVVDANFEETQKKRVDETVSDRQAIQKDEEDMNPVASINQAPAAEYIPPHKRSIKPKPKIDIEVPSQEQPTMTGYYVQSDTESSGGYTNSRAPMSGSTKESTP
ncbi:uncharacterized protein ColSpa_08052 [Colletotrichum spaethianum]|uniref:Uncharacterized protein n=1 Tax=Colletotrichum spaethianum TaxID=700344 RepID=A0AA37P914_9PEZI|nr:uncharacterized protein ColSpa_08052 [Colletotrichum spaethianum]GKT47871.1 hypothetical protein ColSpa_08052 [Colletotrichum spaethianum]